MHPQRLLLHGMVVGGGVLFLWALGQASLIVVFAALAFSAGLILTAESKSKAVSTASFVWLGGIILVAFGLPMISKARPRHLQFACRNNMKQIAVALSRYHDDYRSFPPAYIADESGTPVHSWRVLILPYLGQRSLYEKYDFDEPWNGPHNTQLADLIEPILYTCPSQIGRQPRDITNYVAVVGAETAWPYDDATNTDDIADGLDATIQLVEIRDSDIQWMEPRDFLLPQGNVGGIAGCFLNVLSSHDLSVGVLHHAKGANVAFVDGRARLVPRDISGDDLSRLMTRDGGEPIEVNRIQAERIDVARVVTLVATILSTALYLWLVSNGVPRSKLR